MSTHATGVGNTSVTEGKTVPSIIVKWLTKQFLSFAATVKENNEG